MISIGKRPSSLASLPTVADDIGKEALELLTLYAPPGSSQSFSPRGHLVLGCQAKVDSFCLFADTMRSQESVFTVKFYAVQLYIDRRGQIQFPLRHAKEIHACRRSRQNW